VKVHFLGAARTTTGSMHLVETEGRSFLLECGLYQGRRGESIERNKSFPFTPSNLAAVVLSHAHIDHCGNLPNLVKHGFAGPIHATPATADLAAIMLKDSAAVQRADAEFLSRRLERRHLPPVEPLYSVQDAEAAARLFEGRPYHRPFKVLPNVTVTFYDAGHILGSAQVALDVVEGNRSFRYLFSGDIGRPNQSILRDPEAVEGVDHLQVESTYGDRDHSGPAEAGEEAWACINAAIGRGGRVIVPAFSVGRTQQLVYALHRLADAGRLPRVPIFVDSPLSVNATEVFRRHPECFDDETNAYLKTHGNPFGMDNLTYISGVEESKRLNDLKTPCIIISASGMAEAGRVRHHIRNALGDDRNLILFVGYCAQHTLGAQLRAGVSPVNIFGEPHEVKARIASVDAFSGHADRRELAAYVRSLKGPLRRIAVVHGDPGPAMAFSQILREIRPESDVRVPDRGEVLEFS
jgi:metallo-beta-lactamase family protein